MEPPVSERILDLLTSNPMTQQLLNEATTALVRLRNDCEAKLGERPSITSLIEAISMGWRAVEDEAEAKERATGVTELARVRAAKTGAPYVPTTLHNTESLGSLSLDVTAARLESLGRALSVVSGVPLSAQEVLRKAVDLGISQLEQGLGSA